MYIQKNVILVHVHAKIWSERDHFIQVNLWFLSFHTEDDDVHTYPWGVRKGGRSYVYSEMNHSINPSLEDSSWDRGQGNKPDGVWVVWDSL